MDLPNEGTYAATCESIGPDTSSKGTPLLDIVFSVQQEIKNGEWQMLPTPMQRHVRIWLSENAWPTSEVKLQKLEFNGDFVNPTITTDWVLLECTHEQYNGRDQERWELANWGGQQERTPPPADVLRKLSARYKSQVSLNPTPPPPPSRSGGVPVDDPGPPPSDDDIPF